MVSISELRNTFLNLDLVKKPLKRHNSEPLLIDSINHHLESASEAAAQKEAIECKVKGNLVGKMNSLVIRSCYIIIYVISLDCSNPIGSIIHARQRGSENVLHVSSHPEVYLGIHDDVMITS